MVEAVVIDRGHGGDNKVDAAAGSAALAQDLPVFQPGDHVFEIDLVRVEDPAHPAGGGTTRI
ncbi:hypothetical protein [Dactylosporangium darangshiense]|uniref:hypothetical protein n=1 Tax=Dactylosporangium darangshiense TaxID=579108 RepID=UPI003645D882